MPIALSVSLMELLALANTQKNVMTTKETISNWLANNGWTIDQGFTDYLSITTERAIAITRLEEDLAYTASFDINFPGTLEVGCVALLDLIIARDQPFENRRVSIIPYASPQFFDIIKEHAERVK